MLGAEEERAEAVGLNPYVKSYRTKWWALAVLMCSGAVLFLNQQLLSLLVIPIQTDLGFSDTQISLLIGLAFSGTYAIAGLPLGRLADRVRRFPLIAAGIMAFSLSTALCAGATNYWQLFLLRMGVGVGEAAIAPAAYSLMPDLFPPQRLGLTIALFTLALLMGGGLAMAVGGTILGIVSAEEFINVPLLGPMQPWRVTFLIVGIPSMLVGVWALLTPEPPRRGAHTNREPALSEVFRYLRENLWTLGPMLLAWGFISACVFAMIAWTPTYLIRVHGWTPGYVGLAYGLTLVVSSTGVVAGGWMSDRASSARNNGRLLVMLGVAALAVPIFPLLAVATNGMQALVIIGAGGFLVNVANAAFPPALQEALPNRMRGLSTGIALTLCTFVGLSTGATSVALITDYVLGDRARIGTSLALVLPLSVLLSIGFAYLAWRNYAKARLAAERWIPS